MEKILIIGGGGYIGTEVIKYFLNKKKKIFVMIISFMDKKILLLNL